MVNGMADGESRESGGKGIGVCPKHFVPWVLTPEVGDFGVMVKGGCHFLFSDQGPLLKGGGDVGARGVSVKKSLWFICSYVKRQMCLYVQ